MLDISSTYPNTELFCNISKETTKFETVGLDGFSDEERKQLGLNLTGGHSNALEIGIRYLGMPTPAQLLEQYRKDKQIAT